MHEMICHDKKFIYVHIPKCGGNSVNSILKEYISNGLGPGGKRKPGGYIQHQHICDIIEREDTPVDDYYKFTFVRNPWDRCVSRYHFIRGNQENNGNKFDQADFRGTTFKEFIINKDGRFKLKPRWVNKSPRIQKIMKDRNPFDDQLDWLTDDDGNIAVDRIGRFEDFQADFNVVCDMIDVPRQTLPYLNSSQHKHYTEYYDNETRALVAEKYALDIEYFGYEFGE